MSTLQTFILAIIACLVLAITTQAGTTITYTYDKQHRLTSADYSAAQADSLVAYQYDAANNLDLEVSITNDQYLKSFLWYLTWIPTPARNDDNCTGFLWQEIWASIVANS